VSPSAVWPRRGVIGGRELAGGVHACFVDDGVYSQWIASHSPFLHTWLAWATAWA
jgi:hypothetical protein